MKKRRYVLLLVLSFILTGCQSSGFSDLPPVISVGVSSDGQYAISVGDNPDNLYQSKGGTAVLWDIKNKTRTILSEQANAYSAFFIPGGHSFMWQDDNDVVHIQNVDGSEVRQFPHFATEGQVMDGQGLYLAANSKWQIFSDYGSNLKKVLFNNGWDGEKPLNLSIGNGYFVSAGWGYGKEVDTKLFLNPAVINESDFSKENPYQGIILWDKTTLQPLTKLLGTISKTYAKISPDGQWVIGGDENTHLFMWATQPPYKQIELLDTMGGMTSKRTHSIAFLDRGQKFIIIDQSRYHREDTSLVYEVGNPQAIGTVDLGLDPKPCVKYYQRNLCTASAPDANILVTGQEDGGGINVYRFHPDTLTMEKIWVAQ